MVEVFNLWTLRRSIYTLQWNQIRAIFGIVEVSNLFSWRENVGAI